MVDCNGYNSRLDQEYADANDTGRSNSIWSLAASYIWDIHTFKVAYQQSSGSTGYHYGGYQHQGGAGDGGGNLVDYHGAGAVGAWVPPTGDPPQSPSGASVMEAG